MTKYRRKWKRYSDVQAEQEYHEARANYYYEVKKAKSNCWNNFLENASGKEIFKTFQYTKQNKIEKLPILQYQSENREVNAITFQKKCNAFLKTLFIKPPESTEPIWTNYQESDNWKWPEVTKDEIKAAIFTSSIKKAAGPDTISFLILQKIYAVLENRFYKLYKALIQFGYHPKCWKQAVGVILKKPNRKATIPKFYRVVSLLNCLGKVAEKIIAARLSYTAETSDLLHIDQIEGRRQKSAIDAVLSLIHDIQLAKHEKKITSVLFMNVKEVFDHVSANHLLKICQKLKLPKSLCFWIRSFLQNRKVQLRFDGNTQEMTDVNIGIPQGSPVSPILFLIYIRFLLSERSNTSERILSFVDDIGLAVSSKSIEENCQLLQKLAEDLLVEQSQNCMQFDVEKTELIHFHSKRFLDLKDERYSVKIGETVFQPKELVKYLGIWLDSKLSFKAHVEKKIALATKIFMQIERLSNTEKELSFQAMRQLYVACMSSVADYGVPVWWNNQKHLLEKFQKLQNKALRKILGVFKTSSISAMEIEASLPPAKVRFNKICKNYALRTLQMHEKHPIRLRVSSGYPPYVNEIELDWSQFLDWNETEERTRDYVQTDSDSELPSESPVTRRRKRRKISKKKQISQLFKITASIADLLLSLKTEEIYHNENEPWKESLNSLIDIKISELSKEEEAIQHKNQIQNLIKYQNVNNLIIYSDDSKCEKTGNLGAGVFYTKNFNMENSESQS